MEIAMSPSIESQQVIHIDRISGDCKVELLPESFYGEILAEAGTGGDANLF
jgi:hypothetical protein